MNPQALIETVNQIFEIEKKVAGSELEKSLARNLRRLKSSLSQAGLQYHNPLGEKYDATRLDCEAMISDNAGTRLSIVEVIKPIIHLTENGQTQLLQRAVVVVA